MTFYDVAAGSAAYEAGRIFGVGIWWVAGLVLLIAGLRRRSASRMQPALPPPGYPPQYIPAGYPGQPDQPAPAGYPPPVAPPKARGTLMIVFGVVLLIVGVFAVLGVVGFSNSNTSSSGPAVGSCYRNTSSDVHKADLKPADCSSPDALYEFAANTSANGTCPDGKGNDSPSYMLVSNSSGTLCYAPNLIQGDCYVPVTEATLTQVDCTSSRGAVKVVKRIEGNSNAACPGTSHTISVPEPARTYCLASANR